jgi:hypothetical protein
MFVGKTKSLPTSGAKGTVLANIRLECKSLPGTKHSSLLETFLIYGR